MPKNQDIQNAVLVYPIKGSRVALAIKTRKVGVGRFNGYGGKIEPDESINDAVLRELWTEAKIIPITGSLEKVGLMTFHNTNAAGALSIWRVHIFFLRSWDGSIKSTKEMRDPEWFRIFRLPFDKMMCGDKDWLPLIISGKKIIGEAHYGPDQKELLKPVEVREVYNLKDLELG